jgi:hypothetical protein
MAEYTITRALVELKKIAREIDERGGKFTVFLATGDAQKVANTNITEAKARTQAQYDEVISRVNRYTTIQNAIHVSNAKTKVTVGGKEMTVLEAINLKKTSGFKRDLLNTLTAARAKAVIQKQSLDMKLENEINSMAQMMAGSGNPVKDEHLQQVRTNLEKNGKVEIVNLKEIDSQIETLQKEVDEIDSELDFILSESNAVTKITVA